VLADQNFPRNVKKTSKPPRDAQESITNVQEDAWEKHAELVQEPLVQKRKLKEQSWKNAEELTEEVAEDFIPEDTENITTEEHITESQFSERKSMRKLWENIPEEKQEEDVEKIKNAESE